MKKILIFSFIFALCAANAAPAAALSYGNAYPEAVYYWDGSDYSGQTGDAQNEVPGDVPLGRDAAPNNSAIYITLGWLDGESTYFNAVWINVTTAAESGSSVWEYRTESGWKTLTVTDETQSFTRAGWGKVSWAIPADWIGSTVEGKPGLWVRAKTTVNYIIQPLAGEINALAYNLQVKVQDNSGASVTELKAENFSLSACDDTTIYGTRELESGIYELALATRGEDLDCMIDVMKSGWNSSGAQATGDIGNHLTSLTATPFELTEVVVPPPPAEEEIAFGSLVKTESSSAVYYYAGDGKRYVFPNDKVFFTWYDDFSSVTTISADELAAMQIGGNVTYRPGKKMIKIQSDPKTYAVTRGGTLRWIQTEALAVALYGQDWNTKIDDVDVAFWPNYEFGTDIQSSSDYSAASELAANPTINIDLGL